MIYQIERKSGSSEWTQIAEVVDIEAYQDTGLSPGTYSYRIRSKSGDLISEWRYKDSVEVSA